MFLRIFAILLFLGGLILLLYGSYAMMSKPVFGLYITFFAFVLWAVASIFIIMSRDPADRIRIRPPRG